MEFRWRVDDGPTLNACLVALGFLGDTGPVILRNTIYFFYFSGGSGPPAPPPFGIRAWYLNLQPIP